MILIQQIYDPKDQACKLHKNCKCQEIRQKEILDTLENNINNPIIDQIILLNEKEYHFNLLKSPKIKIEIISKRLTYQDAIKYASNIKDKIFILANNDIYFDKTLELAKNFDFNKKIIALTRHEIIDGRIVDQSYVPPISNSSISFIYKVRRDQSHDAWIFRTPIQQFPCEFELGQWGCEGSFMIEARKNTDIEFYNGYPYIKAIHNHESTYRFSKIKYSISNDPNIGLLTKDIYNNTIDPTLDYFKISSLDEVPRSISFIEDDKTRKDLNRLLIQIFKTSKVDINKNRMLKKFFLRINK